MSDKNHGGGSPNPADHPSVIPSERQGDGDDSATTSKPGQTDAAEGSVGQHQKAQNRNENDRYDPSVGQHQHQGRRNDKQGQMGG